MPITNNNKVLIDVPFFQLMATPPAASAAGACMTGDGARFLYYLVSATSFWRYDAWADSWQQLANPPGGTVGAGTALQWDSANNRIWALISNGVAAPTFQYYDPATNAWTARSVTNLPGTFGTDADMCMPTIPQGAVSSDFIYLIGNASTVFYRFQVTTNTWSTSLTAQPSACGAGCGLTFLPGHGGGNDHIIRVRGAAANTIDYYSISGNSWTPIAYQPATETFSAGTYMCKILSGTPSPRIAVSKDTTGRVFEIDLSAATGPRANMLATQSLITNGAAVVGKRMDTVLSVDGIEFLFLIPNTASQLVRMPLIA